MDPAEPAAAPWILFGCGYTATRLARRLLAEGARVIATRLTGSGAAATAAALWSAATVRVVDLRAPAALFEGAPRGALLVHSVPPADDSRQAEQIRFLEEALVASAGRAGVRRIVYLSSTGVYGSGGGAWIDEDAPTDPRGPLARRRHAAESALLAACERVGIEAVALRAAAIYGPGRGVHVRIAAGTYRAIGDGFVSRIHVDDLASAVRLAALVSAPARRIYNVADDLPTRTREYAAEVARRLGCPPPPWTPLEQAPPDARDLFGGDRRIANRRLLADLGLELSYPTWREGLEQALAEQDAEEI